MSSKLNLLLENRFLGHKQAVYDLQLDGFGGWYSAGSEGWIVHWQGGSESNGVLIAQTGEPIYCIYVLGNKSEYILAGGQSGMVYAFRRIVKSSPTNLERIQLNTLTSEDLLSSESNSIGNPDFKLNSENEINEDLKFEKMWEHKIHDKGVFDFIEISTHLFLNNKPDQKSIVSCSADGSVALWDLENPVKHQKKSSSIPGTLRCIDANSNLGNCIRVGGHLGKIFEWEILGSSWEDFEWTLKQEFNVGQNTIFQMVHHQNGYAFGGRDAKIWLADDHINIHNQIDAHWFSIHALAFSPQGNYLVSGSMDKSIRLWNAVSGEILVHKELAHRSSVNQIIWLDSETLISCSDDAQIISWKIIH